MLENNQGQEKNESMNKEKQKLKKYYEIKKQKDKLLGKGAFSSVYLGKADIYVLKNNEKEYIKKDEKIALKEIPKNLDQDTIQSISNEIGISSTLDDNKYIVGMIGFVDFDGYSYIAYEYCNGGDLRKYISFFVNFDENLIQVIMLNIVNGLIELFKKNVVHHDIKPENILLQLCDNEKDPEECAIKVKQILDSQKNNNLPSLPNNNNNNNNNHANTYPNQNIPYFGLNPNNNIYTNINNNFPMSMHNNWMNNNNLMNLNIMDNNINMMNMNIMNNNNVMNMNMMNNNNMMNVNMMNNNNNNNLVGMPNFQGQNYNFPGNFNNIPNFNINNTNNNNFINQNNCSPNNNENNFIMNYKNIINVDIIKNKDTNIYNQKKILQILKEHTEFKLSDFGLSKLKTEIRKRNLSGSPLYMSPELFKLDSTISEIENKKVDIWALGVVAYELFFGKRPFEAFSIPELSKMYEKGTYFINLRISHDGKSKTISKEFFHFLNKCLQKDPEKRANLSEINDSCFLRSAENYLEKMNETDLEDYLNGIVEKDLNGNFILSINKNYEKEIEKRDQNNQEN